MIPDAMDCQTDVAHIIADSADWYLLAVKINQLGLQAHLHDHGQIQRPLGQDRSRPPLGQGDRDGTYCLPRAWELDDTFLEDRCHLHTDHAERNSGQLVPDLAL